jgi:hypothetical protein
MLHQGHCHMEIAIAPSRIRAIACATCEPEPAQRHAFLLVLEESGTSLTASVLLCGEFISFSRSICNLKHIRRFI